MPRYVVGHLYYIALLAQVITADVGGIPQELFAPTF